MMPERTFLPAAALRIWLVRLLALAFAVGAVLLVGVVAGAKLEQGHVFERAAGKAERTWGAIARRNGWYEEPDARAVSRRRIATTLFDLEETSFSVGPFSGGQGGSIVEYDGGIIFVEPTGHMGFASYDGHVRDLGVQVPMNRQDFVAWMESSPDGVYANYFRAMDSVIVRGLEGRDWLVVSHQRMDGNCVHFVVSRIAITPGDDGPQFDDAGWKDAFVAQPCVGLPPDEPSFQGLESGGRLVELAPGRLLVSTGDFAFDGVTLSPGYGQDPNSDLGKILELDLASGEAEIFSMGHRNPQGLTITEDGQVWETEHGPKGGDEVNHVVRGGDYGWPITTYGLDYGTPRADWPTNRVQGRHDPSYALPSEFYSPSIGLSNLVEAPANEFPLWRGDLIVGSLEGQTLHRLRLRGLDDVVSDEPIPVGFRVRDLIVLQDGRLAALADGGAIHIFERVREDGEGAPFAAPPSEFSGYVALSQARQSDPTLSVDISEETLGEKLFGQHCASCHNMNGRPGVGPDLRGVMGRRIAGAPGYDYSPALKAVNGRWNENRLWAFIADPQGEVPGTKMAPTSLYYYDIEALFPYFYANK